jgi:hypothetical protein
MCWGYSQYTYAEAQPSQKLEKRGILVRLRNQVFHSLEELNCAIWRLLDELNNRKFQKLDCSRKGLFLQIDKKYYSVPWNYYGKKVQACLEKGVVSVFFNEKRIAVHTELNKEYRHSTNPEHMPPKHRAIYDWTIATVIKKG